MSHGNIRLSEKHGVNPSLMVCWFCSEATGVALAGRLPNDAEAPCRIYDPEPCEKCREWMTKGIILIGVNEALTTDMRNPYRDGRFAVVTEEAIARMVTPDELAQDIIRKRFALISTETWDALGIPVSSEA